MDRCVRDLSGAGSMTKCFADLCQALLSGRTTAVEWMLARSDDFLGFLEVFEMFGNAPRFHELRSGRCSGALAIDQHRRGSFTSIVRITFKASHSSHCHEFCDALLTKLFASKSRKLI